MNHEEITVMQMLIGFAAITFCLIIVANNR